MKKPTLYHGSPNNLKGKKINPSQGEDSDERPENKQFGVYATDRKDLAIAMGIIGCKDVVGGSIDKYKKGKLNARIYGEYPKQKFIYVYHLPNKTFKQTKIDKHQFISFESVKPIKTEKITIKNHTHLIRKATKKETEKWTKKYNKKLEKKILKRTPLDKHTSKTFKHN